MLSVDESGPGEVSDDGLKLAVAPGGKPEAESATIPFKLPESVIVVLATVPWLMLNGEGEADSANEGLKTMSITG